MACGGLWCCGGDGRILYRNLLCLFVFVSVAKGLDWIEFSDGRCRILSYLQSCNVFVWILQCCQLKDERRYLLPVNQSITNFCRSVVDGLFGCLLACDDDDVNPRNSTSG